MTEATFTVFLVDDDAGVLKALSRVLRARGYEIQPFTSSQAFLAVHDVSIPGCAVFDVSMPDLDGLQLQQALTAGGSLRPVIFLTGKGDIPTSVRAMRAGAIDFLTKPVNDADLLAAIARAREGGCRNPPLQRRAGIDQCPACHPDAAGARSHDRHVVAGRLNKQIAGDLGTVEKTIKVHRGRVMEKWACARSPILCASRSARAYGPMVALTGGCCPKGQLDIPVASPQNRGMSQSARRIAIVDDDASVLKASSRLLGTRSFVPEQSDVSARAFLELCCPTATPECLIVDLQMPDMTGLELQLDT